MEMKDIPLIIAGIFVIWFILLILIAWAIQNNLNNFFRSLSDNVLFKSFNYVYIPINFSADIIGYIITVISLSIIFTTVTVIIIIIVYIVLQFI